MTEVIYVYVAGTHICFAAALMPLAFVCFDLHDLCHVLIIKCDNGLGTYHLRCHIVNQLRSPAIYIYIIIKHGPFNVSITIFVGHIFIAYTLIFNGSHIEIQDVSYE